MRRALLVVMLAALPVTASAQADTISPRPLFTWRDAILAGGVAAGVRLIHPLDEYFAVRLQDSTTQDNRTLQTIAKFVRTTATPGSYIIGGTMYVAGRLTKDEKLADLGLHGTEALVVGEAAASVLKSLVGRARPYAGKGPDDFEFGRGYRGGNAMRSFPSGHSVAAFAAAAAVTSETSRWAPDSRWIVGPVLYGGATLVGASRMYNNQHWASDVIMGAGIGTFAGLKVVRFHHSHPGNRLDRWLLAGSIVPTEDGGHALRLSLLPGSLPGDRPR